ncbi:MAG TPA: phytanoyl-CoA dioxygenase family protein [Rhizomicrobium sp.]|jgi:phytanoyl-CoA hydroxylase|nr:phytanoyl-CoA dioxygenase family protein [Rhizomicrobium sp.]
MSTNLQSREIKPHPLNTDFAWSMPAPKGLRRLTPAQYRAFDTEGFVKLEGVFTPQEVASVIAAIDPLEQQSEEYVRSQGGRISISEADVITFTTHLVTRSDALRDFASHPRIKDICHDLIGDDVRLYWDQSVYKKTGKEQEFPWHQDNGYTFILPQQYLTLWIPLVDVDAENGCPWIAPGVHRGGTLTHWLTGLGYKCLEDVPGAVCVPGKAGDVIAFSSLAPHRTGPNLRKGSVRKAYILQYAPDGAYTNRNGLKTMQDDPERQFKVLEGGV